MFLEILQCNWPMPTTKMYSYTSSRNTSPNIRSTSHCDMTEKAYERQIIPGRILLHFIVLSEYD